MSEDATKKLLLNSDALHQWVQRPDNIPDRVSSQIVNKRLIVTLEYPEETRR